MENYFLAPSLVMLRDQINATFPGRLKDSDGWIGDRAHAARVSDHNPNQYGAVLAIDITASPLMPNAETLGAWLWKSLLAERDPRLGYMIHKRHIVSGDGTKSPWIIKSYWGPNPHDTHVHVSVRHEPSLYESDAPWALHPIPSPIGARA